MMQIRYSGQFLSRSNVKWRVDILQEAESPFATIGELDFDADEAVSIEWAETSKEEVLCGSTATIQIISPGDRTYVDLYAIKPGFIRCDIYRNGALYWSGSLDSEFYEEPYERASQYNVQLTFSDFGLLDRMKFDMSGMQTLEAILQRALAIAGIQHVPVNEDMVSTTFEDGQTISHGGLSINTDNFYDEDGEPMSYQEVLEGILQPLGIRMIQRCGTISLYDLHGIFISQKSPQSIKWSGDAQTLGVDKVANNVKISFSPYSATDLIDDEIIYSDKYSEDKINIVGEGDNKFEPGYGQYYSFRHSIDKLGPDDLIDFTVFISENAKCSSLVKKHGMATFAHFLPIDGGGSETSCLMVNFRCDNDRAPAGAAKGEHWISPLYPFSFMTNQPFPGKNEPLMVLNAGYIHKLGEPSQFMLRLQQEILIDGRYNPFSDDNTDSNCGGYQNIMKTRTAWLFIRVAIEICDENGKALYHYNNHDVASTAAIGRIPIGDCSYGRWEPGEDKMGMTYLTYYDKEDLAESAGICNGWSKNHQCVGMPDKFLNPSHLPVQLFSYMTTPFKEMDDGEYITYPPCGGYLRISVMPGMKGHDCFNRYDPYKLDDNNSRWDQDGIFSMVRWMCYKVPKLELIRRTRTFKAAQSDDIEYHGYLNKFAKEPIELNTICGTTEFVNPSLRGAYYRTSAGTQVVKMCRAGKTDHPEKLLIGSIYSQFSERKTTLSGECSINPYPIGLFHEQNQGSKKFIIKGEVQNLIQDTSETTYVELSRDEYSVKEIE